MDVQNLREKYPCLLSYMKENGYSVFYIRKFKTAINHILQEINLHDWKSYEDVYRTYSKQSDSKTYLRSKRGIIGIIKRFDLDNVFPHPAGRTNFLRVSSYELLPDEYKQVIDTYCEKAKQIGKKDDTIYTESHNATTFLLSLYQNGTDSLNGITEKGVLEVFFKEGKLYRGCSYKKNISAVFKTCIPFFPENTCTRVLSCLPAFRKKRKNIQYLTTDEVSALKAVLTDPRSSVSLRDKAIGLLALYTGLRCCDIAGLTLADIDWADDLIRIRQQKTGASLELPMRPIIGNAIYDYLIQERPKTVCEKVFVTETNHVTKLKSTSIWNVSKKIMNTANIRMKHGDRRGFHIFRHHMAISLLENQIPQPVISRVPGHLSPNSVEPYLSADFLHLRECALSIKCFPLREEVLP